MKSPLPAHRGPLVLMVSVVTLVPLATVDTKVGWIESVKILNDITQIYIFVILNVIVEYFTCL